MSPAGQGAAVHQIAVGEQSRTGRGVGFHPDREARQHVRAVGPVGNLAEPLGLALRAEPAPRHVETFQRSVARRVDLDLGLEREGVRDLGDGQMFVGDYVGPLAQRLSVNAQGQQLQANAVQDQRAVVVAAASDFECRPDPGCGRFEREIQVHRVHQEGGGTVVGQVDGLGGVGAHGWACSPAAPRRQPRPRSATRRRPGVASEVIPQRPMPQARDGRAGQDEAGGVLFLRRGGTGWRAISNPEVRRGAETTS